MSSATTYSSYGNAEEITDAEIRCTIYPSMNVEKATGKLSTDDALSPVMFDTDKIGCISCTTGTGDLGTISFFVHGVPRLRHAFDLDFTILRREGAAISLTVKTEVLKAPTSGTTPVAETQTGTLAVPAAQALVCSRRCVFSTGELGSDGVRRPRFYAADDEDLGDVQWLRLTLSTTGTLDKNLYILSVRLNFPSV